MGRTAALPAFLSMANELKINLGSGQNPLPGYVNVDKFGTPNVLWDLEQFPWPWDTSSVDEIRLFHVLEHLGETRDCFMRIVQELYRVSKPAAKIHITVPHPYHPDFFTVPTHVLPIMEATFMLFSKAHNRMCVEQKAPDSPLGLYYDVDFETVSCEKGVDPRTTEWVMHQGWPGEKTKNFLARHIGFIKELKIILRVIKEVE
jgi:SAM-dependent methyltransferase